MKRRELLKNSVLVSGGATLAFPNVLRAATKKFRWRLVMVIPKTLPIWGAGVEEFAENVELMSDGRLQIKVYGAGELVPPLGTFDAVKAGQVQMGHSASYYWQGKIPASVFFCTVPYGMGPAGMRSWLTAGGGQELWDKLYAEHGLLAIPAGNTGTQMGGWFNKEIKTIKDFDGLKMRIPGLGGKVIAKAGGKPILVPGGEIFTNLSTGVIDATEWVGPYHDYVMGFHKAAKFYYYPGWHEPGPVLELMINKTAWMKLPKDLQAMVRSAAGALDAKMLAEWNAKDAEYLTKIRKEGKVKLKQYPADVLKDLREFAEQVKADVAKTSKLATEIHQSMTKFQAEFEAHQDLTERAYVTAQKS